MLQFRLIGVNNQNFIMSDEETGSWWQQVTGEAILGPLKGRRLERMPFEQVTFGLWVDENPDSTVLESRAEYAELYGSNVLEHCRRHGRLDGRRGAGGRFACCGR